MSGLDPYHALGLRRNPFYAPSSLQIPPERWLDWGYSQAPAPGQRQFVQILGVKGAGKTSHLLHWRAQTGGAYFYQPPWDWRERPPTSSPEGRLIVYWDEANRIPLPTLLWSLGRAYRYSLTVVVATHWNLAPWAQMMGFPVQTRRLGRLTPELLQAWISRQLQAELIFSDLPAPDLELTPEMLAEIAAQSQGSWRQAASFLHRWTARLAQKRRNHSGLILDFRA
ncbi:MAG: hypothetical protein VKN60_00805 [Cyanobacteriota bacterium]|nr:hypothetical protein [Cyanobacteriota bacterium]